MSNRVKQRILLYFIGLAGISVLGMFLMGLPSPTSSSGKIIIKNRDVSPESIFSTMESLPLSFELNRGQTDPQIKYLARGPGYHFLMKKNGPVLRLFSEASGPVEEIKLKIFGANASPKIIGTHRITTKSHYFKGQDPSRWVTNIPNFAKVKYEQIYPGVDLVFYGNQQKMEYDFVLGPGADPDVIRLGFKGADKIEIDEGGQVHIFLKQGELIQHQPIIYQEINGTKKSIQGKYVWKEGGQVGIQIASYHRDHPLIIDPVLEYAGYVGGAGAVFSDIAFDIAADQNGAAYITGWTKDLSEIVTVGPDLTQNGGDDAYVAKIRPDGTGFEYVGYIGGAKGEQGSGIVVDETGSAYVVGKTLSDGVGGDAFPTTVGPDLTFNGVVDAFVTKLTPDGSGLVYSGLIGGSENDAGHAIDLDNDGNAYILGSTFSQNDSFPVLVGPDDFNNSASIAKPDGFIAKVKADGTGLVYAGFIGGNGFDFVADIAVDRQDGSAYVIGTAPTGSAFSWPTLVGPDLTHNGGDDVAVTKVKPDGSGFAWSGFIGGADEDRGNGIAVGPDGYVYIVGDTRSTENEASISFPVKVGPDLTHNNNDNGFDAFVGKLEPDGSGIVYLGYVGGSNSDDAQGGVAVDKYGRVYMTGFVDSTENDGFPVLGGPDLTHNGGGGEAYVARVKSDGSGLDFATFLGGSGNDGTLGIAVDNLGGVYVTGRTDSAEYTVPEPFPVKVGPDLTYNGGTWDAFVVKYYDEPPEEMGTEDDDGLGGAGEDTGGGNQGTGGCILNKRMD